LYGAARCFALFASVLNGANQKTTLSGAGPGRTFSPGGVDHIDHELGDRAGCKKLACVANALRVFQFFVEIDCWRSIWRFEVNGVER
jgi:hypothetical protein